MNITYAKAKLSDIKAMQAIVLPEVMSGVILFRSDDEVATNIRSYVLARDEDKVIGFAALHIYAEDLAEVRSLIVDSDYRGQNIGGNLVLYTINEARELGIKRLFTLTYQKVFFEKLNFKEIAKESLPEHKIWADCVKCKHFPICDEIALIIEP
ncbi:MAG TPA: N-acetyltransferase [Campylobacterales bacterium]|nr:N-acetyltransferase [Campylobacterales bacterium]